MKPIYVSKYITDDCYPVLFNEVGWVNRDAPRDECFMSVIPDLEYTYGEKFPRTYNSVPMHDIVKTIMAKLNEDGSSYNVCFLNYYKGPKEHLGWHADDSPEMDKTHPIAVISFGAERFIWYKEQGFKGNIPDENKILLEDGSLFIMPAGFQEVNFHKIPKHDKPCGGRISLTFRKFVNLHPETE